MKNDLVRRVAALEGRAAASNGVGRDFRVIEMHISRAEDKILRMARGSSTRSELPLLVVRT